MDTYVSPFSSRYASDEMSALFSERKRALCFRSLWIALAKAQRKLGLPITSEQITEMEKQQSHIPWQAISSYEKKLKHDVMAHIYAFGDQCPKARGILHLGATSCYVTDNADLIIMKEALQLLLQKLAQVIRLLAAFAEKKAKTPCVGYTHFQSAQPTTFGKRATLWLQDLLLDGLEWERLISQLPFLGAKGATGTQSAFLTLFNGSSPKVEQMETLIAKAMGFARVLPISGQTYTRKIDLYILHSLASFASSVHKMATDIRLLAHEGEMLESFDPQQVGSSAMPHKRNPIYSERICGLARFVISLSQNGPYTAATQWLERSLDDSSNRRLTLPEAFLGVDAILQLLHHLVSHLSIDEKKAKEHLKDQSPHLVLENVLMKAVLKGKDRQETHELLKKIASLPTDQILPALQRKLGWKKQELAPLLTIDRLIGNAPKQVQNFIRQEVYPFLRRYRKLDLAPVEK
ncbi:MAG: adenylosuccinate lyase [Chlamydiia bacterium]|nr:adenylosuccinate lyase [Chlamydiia bacterium]